MPFDRSTPLYQQVVETLSARIASGSWAPGTLLPSEPKLADSLGVSQGTLRKALQLMAAENLLERRQGVGTFVAKRNLNGTNSFFVSPDGTPLLAELRAQVLLDEPLPDRVRQALSRDDTEGWCIEQLSSLGNRPAFLERIYIPKDLLSGLNPALLPAHLPELWHRLAGRFCHSATHNSTPIPAPASVAWAVAVPARTPIQHVVQITHDLSDTAIEYRDIYIAPGPWAYHATQNFGN